MKRNILVCLVCLLMMGGMAFGEAGRFQLVVSGERLFKIDTSNGKTWRYTQMLFTDKTGGRTRQIPIYYWEEINEPAQAKKDIEYLRKLAEKAKKDFMQNK